jgi:hypothetical protein
MYLLSTNIHTSFSVLFDETGVHCEYIRRAKVIVGLINLCKGLFSLNARTYYTLKSGT